METVERIGIKKAVKCHQLPEEAGLTQKAIGAAKSKCCQVYTDPYAGGERPGRLARPNVVMATTNQRVHAHVLLAMQPTQAHAPLAYMPLAHALLLTQALVTQTHSHLFPTPTYAFPPASAL